MSVEKDEVEKRREKLRAILARKRAYRARIATGWRVVAMYYTRKTPHVSATYLSLAEAKRDRWPSQLAKHTVWSRKKVK